jgi:hypothetical protein
VPSVTGHAAVSSGRGCEDFLHDHFFKGTPSARQAGRPGPYSGRRLRVSRRGRVGELSDSGRSGSLDRAVAGGGLPPLPSGGNPAGAARRPAPLYQTRPDPRPGGAEGREEARGYRETVIAMIAAHREATTSQPTTTAAQESAAPRREGSEMNTDRAPDTLPVGPATEWMKGARIAHDLIVRQVQAGYLADRIAERWDEALAAYADATATPAQREWHAGLSKPPVTWSKRGGMFGGPRPSRPRPRGALPRRIPGTRTGYSRLICRGAGGAGRVAGGPGWPRLHRTARRLGCRARARGR